MMALQLGHGGGSGKTLERAPTLQGHPSIPEALGRPALLILLVKVPSEVMNEIIVISNSRDKPDEVNG